MYNINFVYNIFYVLLYYNIYFVRLITIYIHSHIVITDRAAAIQQELAALQHKPVWWVRLIQQSYCGQQNTDA